MKANVKRLVFVIVFVLVCINALGGYAEDVKKTVEVYFNLANFKVNGRQVMADSINYNGKNYLPVRDISEMLYSNVSWDAATNTVEIKSGRIDRYSVKLCSNIQFEYNALKEMSESIHGLANGLNVVIKEMTSYGTITLLDTINAAINDYYKDLESHKEIVEGYIALAKDYGLDVSDMATLVDDCEKILKKVSLAASNLKSFYKTAEEDYLQDYYKLVNSATELYLSTNKTAHIKYIEYFNKVQDLLQ